MFPLYLAFYTASKRYIRNVQWMNQKVNAQKWENKAVSLHPYHTGLPLLVVVLWWRRVPGSRWLCPGSLLKWLRELLRHSNAYTHPQRVFFNCSELNARENSYLNLKWWTTAAQLENHWFICKFHTFLTFKDKLILV